MTNYIIKACGNIQDVIQQLNTLKTIFGKGCPLSHVAMVMRYSKIRQAAMTQFEKDGKIK